MITYQRLGGVVALAAVTISLTACGVHSTSPSTTPPPGAAAPQSAPSSTASPTGVTTPADVFGDGCASLPQGNTAGSVGSMGPQPVATAASTNPLLSTTAAAVKAAALVDVLNTQRTLTVFAPSNSAFAEVEKTLGQQKFNALLANKDALGTVLKYHVLAHRYDRQGLVAAGGVPTLAGGTLQIKDAGDTITVTDGSGATAHVLCGNVPTANATVFVIDKVLVATDVSVAYSILVPQRRTGQ